MHRGFYLGIVLAFAVGGSGLPYRHSGSLLIPAAAAKTGKSRVQNLLTRLRGEKLPAGIVKTNGRLEATLVDVGAKYAGRVADLTVEEGSEVKEGQVIGRISSPEYDAQLVAAKANLDRAHKALTEAEAMIVQRTAVLAAAKSDFERGKELVGKQIITQQTFDQRQRNYEGAVANVDASNAQRDQAAASIRSAEAEVTRIEAILHDLILVSPRTGRVQYQLARNGEVVAAGAKVVTVIDLHDVYMTIFLPAASAGKLGIGDEARIVLDPVPQFVVPATVSFVAADAQFTPKTVETSEEREKLMFRVKLKVDLAVLKRFAQRVKTGVRGMGFVRTAKIDWPTDLQAKLPQ